MSLQLAKISSVIAEDAQACAVLVGPELQDLSGAVMLVTGAGGFLCSFLLDVMKALNESVLAKPCAVIALDNFQSGLPERIQHLQNDSHIHFVKHDMRQQFLPSRQVDYIVHGASIASPPFYRKFPLETMDVNIAGTRHLLDLCLKGCRSMLYLSTSEVYGDPDPAFVPTPETYLGNVSCTGPRACYDESKRVAETLCTIYHRLHSLPVKIARPFNVFGPGQRIDDGRIIPDLMLAALRREPFVLYSDGKATRSFCYVPDAIRAMLLLLVSAGNGEAYNIGNEQEEITIGDVARLVSKIAAPPAVDVRFEASSDPLYLTDNPQRRCPDLEKLKRLTGYKPAWTLEQGLRRTLKSYRELAVDNPVRVV
jgi:dTDP-glucose 4,6-dehydratase/UDP-glucuronate decarboxylase